MALTIANQLSTPFQEEFKRSGVDTADYMTCIALLRLRGDSTYMVGNPVPGKVDKKDDGGNVLRHAELASSFSGLGSSSPNSLKRSRPSSPAHSSKAAKARSTSSKAAWVPVKTTTRPTLLETIPMQRKVAASPVTLEELRNYFDMPIVDVAKHLGICTTLLKKICRQIGIKRWPHRQIRSMRNSIAALRASEAKSQGQPRVRFGQQASALEAKLKEMLDNPHGIPKFSKIKKEIFSSEQGSPKVDNMTSDSSDEQEGTFSPSSSSQTLLMHDCNSVSDGNVSGSDL